MCNRIVIRCVAGWYGVYETDADGFLWLISGESDGSYAFANGFAGAFFNGRTWDRTESMK